MLRIQDAGTRCLAAGDTAMTHQTPMALDTALKQTSIALRDLHKTLLDFQARESGFQGAPLDLFDRAIQDSGYAWLRPLSALIVEIDGYLDETDREPEPQAAARFRRRIAALIDANQERKATLSPQINRALQTSPEAGSALGALRQALNSLPGRP